MKYCDLYLKNHCAKWSVSLLHRCPHSIVVLHVNFHPVCIVCLSKQPGEWHSSSSFKSSFQHRSLKEPKVCFNVRHCLDGQTCFQKASVVWFLICLFRLRQPWCGSLCRYHVLSYIALFLIEVEKAYFPNLLESTLLVKIFVF